jgi:Arc/MetJ family transcription regulator
MATASRKSARPKPKSKPLGRRAVTEGKVRKEFWLDPAALAEAQAILGTTSERETVEMALDLVAFRHELVAGARALRTIPFAPID